MPAKEMRLIDGKALWRVVGQRTLGVSVVIARGPDLSTSELEPLIYLRRNYVFVAPGAQRP